MTKNKTIGTPTPPITGDVPDFMQPEDMNDPFIKIPTPPQEPLPPLDNLPPLGTIPEQTKTKSQIRNYDPSRRGAVIKDIFGNREQMRRRIVNNLGLSQMILPPLVRKGMATYRVILDKDQINPATKQPAEPQPITIPGSYMLHDKFEPDPSNRWKEMKNATGRKEKISVKNGPDQLVDVIDWIDFPDGVKRVDIASQYRLYVFLELHPMNKTNRHRPNGAPAAFERVDLAFRSDAYKVAQEELADEANDEVRKLSDRDKIIGLAASAGIQTMTDGVLREISLMKSDLRTLALKDPIKFFSLSNNFAYAVKTTVHEALSIGIVEIEHDRKRFITPYTDEPLFVYVAGEDPVEQFVDFLRNKDNVTMDPTDPEEKKTIPIYDVLRNMLDYWDLSGGV